MLPSATDSDITGLFVLRNRKVAYRPEFEEASQTGFVKALLRQELVRQRETKLAHVALILVGRGCQREEFAHSTDISCHCIVNVKAKTNNNSLPFISV